MATITENFNRADSTTIIGNLLTWTQVSGTWGTFSNQGYKASTGTVYQAARAESALDSTDQYAQVIIGNSITQSVAGPCVRFAAAAQTYYTWGIFDNVAYLIKVVAGVNTALGNVAHTFANGELWRIEANGSTIKGIIDGVELLSLTDTSITTGLYTGLNSYNISATFESFEAGDLGAAAGQPAVKRMGGIQFNAGPFGNVQGMRGW